MKFGFIFPGQGSQYLGMGKDFYEKYPLAKEMFERAETLIKIPLKKKLFLKMKLYLIIQNILNLLYF